MKKLLLLSAIAGISLSSSAQARLSLYEEFSGENCSPCAAANPGLWTLLSSGTNPSKVLLIKYQSPIPSAGPIYLAYTTVTNARLTYYTVPFAPYGRLNGTGLGTGTAVPGSPGHVSNLTQADIDAGAAATSPFKIEVTAAYNTSGDSVSTTVKVTCMAAYAPSGASLKLRLGMIEHLVYATAPGTNGEKDFHNVVREMYPDAAGTTVPNAWAVGDVQTYVIKGKVRSMVTKANGPQMVAWIQNETTKDIPQAAISAALPKTFATDIKAAPVALTTGIACTGSSITGAKVTLSNPGTTTATAATIYYRAGSGAWASQPWTGSLAAGASTTVTLGTMTAPATAGYAAVTDSVVFAGDQDVLNNVATSTLLVVSTTATSLPITTDFEAAGFPANYYAYDADMSGQTWINGSGGPGSTYCHSGVYMPWYKLGSYSVGSSSMLILPTPAISGSVALDFWEAYAQNTASNNDKLEVVYSSDCGANWTSLWSVTGSAHATTAPTTTYWLPDRTIASTWAKRSVNISSLPANSILAIKATAGGGNNLFLDDVNIRAGLSVKEGTEVVNNITVGPNPASSFANVSFNLASGTKVQVLLIDVMGKVVSQVADENMTSGNHQLTINTSAVAAGIYMVKINTENGSVTERLSVVK